ncbi:hypothetical protein JKP88DRAFT_270620 [Tribonema minus]|uniref:N-acetyltransferase domain-containing protein n=1 Tax=Tribonema minus TaxID=303371 RepID=A0A836CA87_9STRA|nr:hypothetical protein JKP88DRAFT_270620 [Tribonema minus]
MDAIAVQVAYHSLPAAAVTDHALIRSSELFSNHYGVWGRNPFALEQGKRVRLSAKQLRKQFLFDAERCSIIQAEVANQLVGHAFVCHYHIPDTGQVSWITQLVVHSEYRGRGIGKRLCRMAWAVDRYYACGLVTSHPHAVRALEAATERACDRSLAISSAQALISHSGIPYVSQALVHFEGGKCLIDTQFFVDHSEVEAVLSGITHWRLGPLEEGKEFFAFTFAQSPKTSPVASQRK